jgi:hypothetical protein
MSVKVFIDLRIKVRGTISICSVGKTRNLCKMRSNWIFVIVISLARTKVFFPQNQGS